MKWIILLAAVGGIFWAANWSYHLLDNAILITDYWKAQGAVEWGMVHFKTQPEKVEVYAFSSVHGYWGIFRSLWPVLALFCLIFFILIPAIIYISRGFANLQITQAKAAQYSAEKRESIAQAKAKTHEEQANKRIQNAYAEQLENVKSELALQLQSLQIDKADIETREAAIHTREQAAQIAFNSAQKQIMELENKLHAMEKTKNNAQQGFKRIKKSNLK